MRKVGLVGFNAFAAAGCFVGGWFLAAAMPPGSFLSPGCIVLGFFGLAYFLRRAESARAD
jgi:hypothetical protein